MQPQTVTDNNFESGHLSKKLLLMFLPFPEYRAPEGKMIVHFNIGRNDDGKAKPSMLIILESYFQLLFFAHSM